MNGNYVVLVKAIHKYQGADNVINSAGFDWIRFKVIFYLLVKQIVHILFTWKIILPKSFCSLFPCRNLFWNTWTHLWLIILFPLKSWVNLWLSGAFKRHKMGALAKKLVKRCYKRFLQVRKYWRYCKMVKKKKRPSFSFIVSTEESSQEKFLNNNQHPSLQKRCIMWTVFNRFPPIFSKVTAFNPDF